MVGNRPGVFGSNIVGREKSNRPLFHLAALTIAVAALAPQASRADEGGVSFWLPGLFGSLAAVPVQPGFGLATILYHTSVRGGGDVYFKGGRFVAGLKADADLAAFVPSYAFATPVFGGQLAVSMMSIVGRNRVGIDATSDGAAGQ